MFSVIIFSSISESYLAWNGFVLISKKKKKENWKAIPFDLYENHSGKVFFKLLKNTKNYWTQTITFV